MMNKKGVSAVIANVLIVLLVVAAIAILWAVIRPAIVDTGEEITSSTACQQINMEILSCDGTSVVVYRGAGGQDSVGKPIVVVEGADNCVSTADLEVLGSEAVPCTVAEGKTLRVGLALTDGNICEVMGSEFDCPAP